MTHDELETAAAALGYALVPADMLETMSDDVFELEALRCDLARITAGLAV